VHTCHGSVKVLMQFLGQRVEKKWWSCNGNYKVARSTSVKALKTKGQNRNTPSSQLAHIRRYRPFLLECYHMGCRLLAPSQPLTKPVNTEIHPCKKCSTELAVAALSKGLQPVPLLAAQECSTELKASARLDGVEQLVVNELRAGVGRQLEQVHACGGRGQPLHRMGVQH
jgi:hypothetical protein